jgi:hypothetical protein
MPARTPAAFRIDDRRNMLREMFYVARATDQVLAKRFGGANFLQETRGTSPGSRTPEWIRTKGGVKQQSLTDNRARLFIVCALLGVSWTTDFATTKTAAAAAVTALSV